MTVGNLDHYRLRTTKLADIADRVIEVLLEYRRAFAGAELCNHRPVGSVTPLWVRARPQWIRVLDFVLADEPVEFALPAFPCKSPNMNKVAGALPDEGELLALRTLQGLCDDIAAVYAPGARLTICSDGHVFADIIGVSDRTVVEYRDNLHRLIRVERLGRLRTFDLYDMWGAADIGTKRSRLEQGWAESVESLRRQARTDYEVARVLAGLTRFLREDSVDSDTTSSQRQRDARRRAYLVLARSRAWSAIVHNRMPRAVRLSIHPQPLGADKFGVSLIPPAESGGGWTTPWHSVVLYNHEGRPRLVRHDSARKQGNPELRDGHIWCYRVQPSTG
ncbi:L-tyrosine/L-tryptophan isonitrile synthase family protein [Mycobacterium tilburgii]|uniref:L-tyrosine/L-tryptophan isonitrile synthase family protein n=1 Tax=Mycobacterium tilburgii TaxID=44467 RepID=UPI0016433EB2|nr:L-tyrosine/L-tryptophan isonitrile synthase family protein [Mycobacterium tilburgii]